MIVPVFLLKDQSSFHFRGYLSLPIVEIVHREKPFEAATTKQERSDRAAGEKSVAIQRVTR